MLPERRPAERRGRLARRLVWAVVVLGGVLAVLWTLQRQLIYFPDPAVPGAVERVLPGARDVTLRTDDELELEAWFVPARSESGGPGDRGFAVLVAPGNAGNRESRAGLARELSRRGLAVLLLDYRGYGGNPGVPTEEGLARDGRAAVEALEELGYPPRRTVYFGESLGTGVVARLAATRPPAGLVLRSPFPDLADVGAHHYPFLPVRLLLRDRFPVTDHLRGSDVPTVVVYGDRDSIVPAHLSARVADVVPNLVEEVVLPDVRHNDPEMFGAPVADAVARLVDHLNAG